MSEDFNVLARIQILPKDVETDLEGVKEKLAGLVERYGKLNGAEIKPIAFGLKSLNLTLLLNDKKGGLDELEKQFYELDGVGEVNVGEVSLI